MDVLINNAGFIVIGGLWILGVALLWSEYGAHSPRSRVDSLQGFYALLGDWSYISIKSFMRVGGKTVTPGWTVNLSNFDGHAGQGQDVDLAEAIRLARKQAEG